LIWSFHFGINSKKSKKNELWIRQNKTVRNPLKQPGVTIDGYMDSKAA